MAGITSRPGITPGTDKYAELIPAFNRMIGSWNIQRLNIYKTNIAAYSLSGAKIYTIGSGGDFNAPRPVRIKRAVIIDTATSPVNRFAPLYLMTDEEWASLSIQDLPNTIPGALYNDAGYPLSSLYLWGQASSQYQLELYTWEAIAGEFATVADALVAPPGYEEAMALNFALRVALLYPLEAKIRPELRREAQLALAAVECLNAPRYPLFRSDAAGLFGGGRRGQPNAIIRMGGGALGDVTWINPLVAPDGLISIFTFASPPEWAEFNGLGQHRVTGAGMAGYEVTNLASMRSIRFLDATGAVIIPAPSDSIRAAIGSGLTAAVAATTAMVAFTITGAVNGTNGSDGNATFTLSAIPSFLQLYRNGVRQSLGTHYTLSSLTITFLAPYIPITGDILQAEGQI